MKVLVSGGHIAPALAVIQHMPEKGSVVYVGRKHPFEGDSGVSLEYEIMRELDIPFVNLKTARLQRRLTKHTVASLMKLPIGFHQAMKVLKEQKPDVVIGFGGYISLPLGIAARLQGIPLLIHEQTMFAGFSNKLLSKFATSVAISWDSSRKYFPKSKTILTGNPHLKSHPREKTKELIENVKKPLLVITGGSAGSHRVNMLVKDSLLMLLEQYEIIHQVGDAREFEDFDTLHELRKTLPEKIQGFYHPMKFIHPLDFDYIYKNASLVIGRAGINTITSILILQKPSLLIPLRLGPKSDQPYNAAFIEKLGLGRTIKQDVSPEVFVKTVQDMIEHLDLYKSSQVSEYQLLHQEAAMKIVEQLYVISQVNSKKKS